MKKHIILTCLGFSIAGLVFILFGIERQEGFGHGDAAENATVGKMKTLAALLQKIHGIELPFREQCTDVSPDLRRQKIVDETFVDGWSRSIRVETQLIEGLRIVRIASSGRDGCLSNTDDLSLEFVVH